jgi:hypothetical protein
MFIIFIEHNTRAIHIDIVMKINQIRKGLSYIYNKS